MAHPPPGSPPAKDAPTGSIDPEPRAATAADVIEALVTQFSQRTAFVRELIQNSLDAGAGHITVELSSELAPRDDPATAAGAASSPESQAATNGDDERGGDELGEARPPARQRAALDRHLWIRISDDGEGMDRALIEEHLLVLFRSPKEDDRTRIGQFGVGFVSLFAIDPDLVIVDTARHGEHLRLVFDRARRYALAAVDEPHEGTEIALRVPTTRAGAAELAAEIRDAVHLWCRYTRADIVIEGEGEDWSWSLEQVRHEFAVDSPLQVVERDEKFRAVVGLSERSPPFAGYYSHGLTLLETRETLIPGVCFRVESGALAHTLTRDNVRRDDGHRAVTERLRELVATRLMPAYREALRTGAASPADSEAARRHDRLLALAVTGSIRLDPGLACLRTATGRVIAPRDCRPRRRLLGWLSRSTPRELLWAPAGSPVAHALEARGHRVLLGPPERHPDVLLVDGNASDDQHQYIEAERAYVAPELVEAPPLVRAVEALLQARSQADEPVGCYAARFQNRGHGLQGRFAIRQQHPGEPERVTAEFGRTGALVLAVDHPSFQRLSGLEAGYAAHLALHLADRSCGDQTPTSASLFEALLGAGGD